MTKRIFRSICGATLIVIIATITLLMTVLNKAYDDRKIEQLRQQTHLAAEGVNIAGTDYLQRFTDKDYRITLIDAEGNVLYDTHYDLNSMSNHYEREEFREAIETGYGQSERYSDTLLEQQFYYAERIANGSVLRLSISQGSIFSLLIDMVQPLVVIIIVAMILSVVLAIRLSKMIVEPLNDINLDDPLSNKGYDEISQLLHRIHMQQQQLLVQKNELRRKKEELDIIIGNMSEGLVLLNNGGRIVSINHAAKEILGIVSAGAGENLELSSKNNILSDVLKLANSGEKVEKNVEINSRVYHLIANPVIARREITGVALIFFDVTEKEAAEVMRREFTANVSHELKTPLHSIAGFAELIANGMVKPEDIIPFSNKIYSEAKRMIQLVEDIIRLSYLDDGDTKSEETTLNLLDIAKEVVETLSAEAQNKEVKVYLSESGKLLGESCESLLESEHIQKSDYMMTGVAQLIEGIIYNLCDNAIKYNHAGGSVYIDVSKEQDELILSVKDTGIGIPVSDQPRVFERFYRVDKSRSKKDGGTGLGLSIVKHAAKVHNAKIDLKSMPGEGTQITVKFSV